MEKINKKKFIRSPNAYFKLRKDIGELPRGIYKIGCYGKLVGYPHGKTYFEIYNVEKKEAYAVAEETLLKILDNPVAEILSCKPNEENVEHALF